MPNFRWPRVRGWGVQGENGEDEISPVIVSTRERSFLGYLFPSAGDLPRSANALWSFAHSSVPTYCSTFTLCRL